MRRIALSIAMLLSLAVSGQDKSKKITWHNTALQGFVKSAKLHHVSFKMRDHEALQVKPNTSFLSNPELVPGNWYSTIFTGHQYLFEKHYGIFPLAIFLAKLDSLHNDDCYNYFDGTIYADRIEISVSQTCPDERGEITYFAINNSPAFFGGAPSLTQLIELKLACTNYRSLLTTDTALFFRVEIKKDSVAHEVETMQKNSSPLTKLVSAALLKTHGWKPYEKSGMKLNSYLQVYIIIKKNGTISADFYRTNLPE